MPRFCYPIGKLNVDELKSWIDMLLNVRTPGQWSKKNENGAREEFLYDLCTFCNTYLENFHMVKYMTAFYDFS